MEINDQCLVERLRIRAITRRHAVGRKSVEGGKPERIANLLDVAADAIETLACNTKEKRHDKP